jgi:UDP-perosamine 4-acetyltransferase
MTVNGPTQIVIIGAGDHGRVILEALRASGESPLGFVEPQRGDLEVERVVDGARVVGDLEADLDWLVDRPRFVVAVGDNRARKDAFDRCRRLGLEPVSVVHPTATVLAGAEIRPGAAVCAAAVIGVAAWIGPNAIVNTSASVDHDNRIEAHSFVAPGAHLAGRVVVGEGAFVGIGASVREGCRIGDWALVAGGSMVIADVAGGARVGGVPARPLGT